MTDTVTIAFNSRELCELAKKLKADCAAAEKILKIADRLRADLVEDYEQIDATGTVIFHQDGREL